MGCKSAAESKLKEATTTSSSLLSLFSKHKETIVSPTERKTIQKQSEKCSCTSDEFDFDDAEEEKTNTDIKLLFGRSFPLKQYNGTSDNVENNVGR